MIQFCLISFHMGKLRNKYGRQHLRAAAQKLGVLGAVHKTHEDGCDLGAGGVAGGQEVDSSFHRGAGSQTGCVCQERLSCAQEETFLVSGKPEMEICGTARNGAQVMDMVERFSPDIVICDIKMPVKTGLEALAECRQRFGDIPLFIMLTSYEDFGFVREALSNQSIDYLVKLELPPETLTKSITKAVSILKSHSSSTRPRSDCRLRNVLVCRLSMTVFSSE